MGSKLANDPYVIEEIARIEKLTGIADFSEAKITEEEAQLIADIKEILKRTTRILRREEPEENVVVLHEEETEYSDGSKHTNSNEAVKIVETKTRNNDVLKAAKLLMEYYNRHEEREASGTGGGLVILTQIDESLMEGAENG